LDGGIGTGRDNKNGEGERTGDARFRGDGCSLEIGDIDGSGTRTGRISGDTEGEREGDGLFKSFDARGGGGGGGARLAGTSLRSEEDDDDRSCPPEPFERGRLN
jgi:hypothetical protein